MYKLLKEKQDLKYKEFIQKLIPNLSKDIIGVRAPVLREIAKDIYNDKSNDYRYFLTDLPHKYHEEDMIHEIGRAACRERV